MAAQGGINTARPVAGDNVSRLFADTLKGDFRAQGCQRLAEINGSIIDQCVAGVPFAEYGGSLATRSFGGALVSRTFYARGQTGNSCSTAPIRP